KIVGRRVGLAPIGAEEIRAAVLFRFQELTHFSGFGWRGQRGGILEVFHSFLKARPNLPDNDCLGQHFLFGQGFKFHASMTHLSCSCFRIANAPVAIFSPWFLRKFSKSPVMCGAKRAIPFDVTTKIVSLSSCARIWSAKSLQWRMMAEGSAFHPAGTM